VTIAGESAGAGSVCMHLASPDQVVSQSQVKVKSLFHKAIVQSGGCLQTTPTVAQGEKKVAASIQAALCPDSQNLNNADVLACMRRQSIKDIMAQQEIYTTANAMDVVAISPVVGGNTVPLSFKDAAALDKLVNVPMIMGGTKSELLLYIGYFWQDSQKTKDPVPPINASTIKKWLGSFYANPAPAGGIEAILKQHPKLLSPDSNVVAQAYGEVLSDYNPQLGINNCLFLHSSDTILRTKTRSNPIYQFEFADANAPVCNVSIGTPCPPFNMGPVHSSELNYLFPNLSFTSKIDGPDLPPASQILANQMVAYWANFAHTGSPNRSGLPQWPVYAGATVAYGGESVMLLEPNNVKPYSSDDQHSCSAFWRKQYPSKL
jgi:para-nitrobenzyl esterase